MVQTTVELQKLQLLRKLSNISKKNPCPLLYAYCILHKKVHWMLKRTRLWFFPSTLTSTLLFYVMHHENPEGDLLKVSKVHLDISALTSADSVCRNKAGRDTLSCSVRLVLVHLKRELRSAQNKQEHQHKSRDKKISTKAQVQWKPSRAKSTDYQMSCVKHCTVTLNIKIASK